MGAAGGGFDHERLDVYRLALDLVEQVDSLALRVGGVRRHLGWQMNRSACSVPLNIAEANGRRTGPDKARHLAIATGSAMECAAALDILWRLKLVTPVERERLRDMLLRITRMLITLARTTRSRPGSRFRAADRRAGAGGPAPPSPAPDPAT